MHTYFSLFSETLFYILMSVNFHFQDKGALTLTLSLTAVPPTLNKVT